MIGTVFFLAADVLTTDWCKQTALEHAVHLQNDDTIEEENMSTAVNSASNAGGSVFPMLSGPGTRHWRSTEARDAKHVAPFDELIAPHVQKLLRVAHRITRNREDAEDAMQDALLRAFKRFDDFEGRNLAYQYRHQFRPHDSSQTQGVQDRFAR